MQGKPTGNTWHSRVSGNVVSTPIAKALAMLSTNQEHYKLVAADSKAAQDEYNENQDNWWRITRRMELEEVYGHVMKEELVGYIDVFGKAQKSYNANLDAAMVEVAAMQAKSEMGLAQLKALY